MKKLIGILMLSGLLVNIPIYGFTQNIALNKPVVTSSVQSGSFTGNLAVDGNTFTRWSSAASDPQWIYVDLGNQYNITSVKITWSSAYGKNYTIDVSNNATAWTTIKSISNNTSLTNTNSVTGTGRYVRIYGTQRGTTSGYSIYELQVNGSLTASCGTPTGLTSSSITTTSATVSWTAVPGAVTYNLQWKRSSSSTWTTVSGITTTSRSLTGLTAGTAYQFQVQTVCSAGSSSYSTATSFTTAASCGIPTGLTSSGITTTSATVSWTAVSGAVTYNLQWKLSSSSTWTTVSGITTTSRSLTGLTAGTAYQFQVQTVCSAGSSSYSTATSFTTAASCGIPTGLTSSGITTTSATVSWTAVSGAVTYNLQWKLSSSSTWTTVSGITTTSRSLTGLTAGAAYQFQVQTVCSAGSSSYSTATSFTTVASCGIPTGLTSSGITTTSATVGWTAVSGAVTYNLQWKLSSSSTWTTVTGITTTTRSLTGLTAGTAYQFQVQTICSAGSSSYSTATSFTTAASCGTPTGLTSSSITTTSATVSWTAVSGVVTYNLQWKLSSSSTWTTVNGITTTSRSLTGLTAGTAYQFQVQTICSAGSSSYSTATSFTTAASCGTPTGLTSSSITTTSATVSWTAVSGVVTYNLQWKPSSSSTWTTVSGITTTSRSLTGLTAGTAYQFQVQTICSAGSSSYSTATSFTTAASCGTPTGLTSSSITTTGATVNWTAVPGAVTYNLQWKTSSSSTWTTVSGITSTSSSLTGLTAGTAYQFQVQTVCSGGSGSSSYSSATSFTTAASCGTPTGLTSSGITTTGATVSWTAVSGAVTYNLQWKLSSSSTWTTVSGITTTSSNLTGLTAGTAYQFQVQTVCSGGSGSGSYSSATSFTTAASCGIPTGLTSSGITTTGATVSWTAVSGAVTYNLQWKLSSSSTWTTVSGITTTSSNLTGLTAGTAYQFQVQTVCSGGSGSGSYSSATSFTTAASCGIPTGLTSSGITTTTATVSWTAVSGAVTYNLQWKLSSSSTWTTVIGITTTSSDLTGLTAGTTYQFQVQTVCSGGSGSGSYSSATSFTTAASCGIPTGLTSSGITTIGATVSWTAVSGAVTYNLQWKESSSSTWTTVSGITATSSDLTGLTDGTTYQFQVQTVCSNGSSSYSTAASFATTASCGTPTDLTSSGITTTSAAVSWTAVSGAVTYNLQWKESSSFTWTTVSGITATSSDLTGLTDGTTYQFQVQTVCSNGSSSYSTAASFATTASCGTPTDLTSSGITTTSAAVSWTAVSGAVTYNLQWKESSSSTWTTVSGITTTSSDLTGLTAGTTYQFQVQTICSAGTSSYSDATSFTTMTSCGIPTDLNSSNVNNASATVSWTTIADAVTYNLRWKNASSSTWNTVSGITTTSSDLTELADGTTYQFKVQTICSAGTSSYSTVASFTTAAGCGTSTDLNSSNITSTSATVSWTAVSGAVTYNLQWKESSSSTWTTVNGITTTSSDLTELKESTTYQFQVQTICSAGSSSYSDAASFATTASCGTPTDLNSSNVNNASATVSWTTIADAVTYNLRWKNASSSTWNTVSGITTTSSDLTGLADGTTYQFKVQTVCSTGSSSYSAVASFTTTISCGIPTDLNSSNVNNASATVSWTAIADAVTYNLRWKDASSSTWNTVSGITTTSSDLTELTESTTYQFQVQTVCSTGSSSYSAVASFTTAISCGIPTDLNSSNVNNASATVSWTAIADAVTYNLRWKDASSSTWNTVSGITTTSSDLTGLADGTTYQFKIQTICSAGTSSYSTVASFTTAASCGTSTDLNSSNITNTSATVSWTAVPGAVTYNLQWKDASSSTWTTVSGITTTSSDLTGLADGTTYQFQVQTVCSTGSSSYSDATSFTTIAPCGIPAGLSSSGITTSSATVSWTAVPGAVTYNFQWKASSSSTWNTVNGITTTSSDLSGLTAGTAYQFQVQTVCSAGSSSYSDATSFTTIAPCGIPAGLSSSGITTSSATVSWAAVPGAVTYNFQWKASSSSTWNTVNGITTTSSDLSGLTAGTTYQFQVQTVCSAGSSSYSDPTSFTTIAPCGIPTGLSSSGITTTTATVSWTAIPGAVTYNLQWKASSSSTWNTVSGITTTSSNLTALTAGETYQFQVQTVCSVGSSSYSTPALFTTPGGITSATGKTYYFSSSTGDDSRTSTQAQSSATPWKTLTKLNSFFSSLQAGDLVLFKRGDVFPGSVTVTTSGTSSAPIAFSAYGTGPKPVITGFTTLTSSAWTSIGNGLYEAPVSAALPTLNMVTLDGAFQIMGKYPKGNSGYLTISSGSTSSISSSGLSGIPSFTGGEIVWRPYHWSMWRATVNSQSSSSVSFTPFTATSGGPTETPQSGFGFFFQNHPNACTSPGEWAYNSSSHKITMYFGAPGPGSHMVNVSSIEYLVTLSSKNYIIFDNIALQGANSRSFTIANSNNITINACDISFSGLHAINANSSCNNMTITNCNISYTNSNGIVASSSLAWNVTGNTISNTGTVAGMGGTGEGQYFGIIAVNGIVTQNKVTNTGYIPICFSGTNNLIQNNLVDTFCTVKDDGGGIYCGGQTFTGTRVIGNIILNGIGALTGTPDNDGRTHGVYVDDGGTGVEIASNTCAFAGGAGIYNHDSHDLNIHDNTTFDNRDMAIKYYNSGNTIYNITLTGNIFFAKTTSQLVSYISGGTASPTSFFTTANNNYWCRPLNEGNTFQTYLSSKLTNYTLATWKSFLGKETNSQSSPITFTDINRIRFEYNATSSDKTINLGANYIDAKGTTYAGSITLAPFTSAVLMSTSGSTVQSVTTAEVVDQTTLIEKPSFVIYPNPVRGNFILQLNNNHTGKMKVQVINQAGSIIHSYLFNKDQAVNQVTLPTNDLSSGVYFIYVQIGTWSDKRKIVKL